MAMNNYAIISDSSCDLSKELTGEKGITVVPFYVSFDGERYEREGTEIAVRAFYEKMVNSPGVYPKSSMPSVQDYMDVFEPLAQEGTPVICICITTKFSGSMQSALTAKEMLEDTYPEARITVVDATVNTVLQGLLVLEAVRMKEQGYSYEETLQGIEEIKGSGRIFFTVGSMDYLQHGGRIGKVAGAAASVLGIRPIITLKEGEIFPSGISRSRKKSMEKVISLLLEYVKDGAGQLDDYHITVGYGYDYEEGCRFRDMVLEELRKNQMEIGSLPVRQIGATIGVHTGPHPIGIGIIKKHVSGKNG